VGCWHVPDGNPGVIVFGGLLGGGNVIGIDVVIIVRGFRVIVQAVVMVCWCVGGPGMDAVTECKNIDACWGYEDLAGFSTVVGFSADGVCWQVVQCVHRNAACIVLVAQLPNIGK